MSSCHASSSSMDIVAPEDGLDDMPLLKRRHVSDCVARPWELEAIFSGMLHLPQPSLSETDRINGCPSVTLVGDALADWEVVFGWIYHKDDFLAKAVTFDILSGALRISTKYGITELRQWAVTELLPSANSGRLHIVLSPNNLRLIARCKALQDALVRVIIDPLTEPGCYNNTSYGTSEINIDAGA
ncbi:hypothetical protein B0H14DRAFT_3532942 [Mycena olivaceomarginata]|nr:hypothetical protein B0H14DRAFT_3532942 [Mycena olivaceomarginata]